jgi:medium-chain acyl-[acyl-carrier-protein] hydrolase
MIHTETLRVRNFETDSQGNLTLLSLANYLQDAADRHAIRLGVGMPALSELGLSWVLHRMKISINRWPRLAEEITIETHPSGLERVYVYRDFRVYDQQRNLLITASSTWLVFDKVKRALVTPAAHFQDIFEPYRHLVFLPRPTPKFSPLLSEGLPRVQVRARHNEIDTNAHVNNSVYFQWLLEPFSADFLAGNACKEIEIQFKKECTRQDLITSVCSVPNAGEVRHWLLDDARQEMAVGITRWQI